MTDIEYDFRKVLEQRNAQPNRRKGDRTRDRVKLAAANCLAVTGYREVKVTDIAEEAGVSSGTFYLYFENKTIVTHAVLEELLDYLDMVLSGETSANTPFGALCVANAKWLAFIRANAGLFRCILQVSDESPEISGLVHRLNARWYSRIARNVARRFPSDQAPSEEALLLTVYSLGSTMDEIVRKLIIYPDENLAALIKSTMSDDQQFAEFLSVIWHRTLYGRPPEEALSPVPEQIAKLILP
jgi:AcrR family transcriptional regulator